MLKTPQSVLFVCTKNALRSPMAQGLMKEFHKCRIFTDSAGTDPREDTDPFAVAVMAEAGIDISTHKPRRLDPLQDGGVDLVVSLSPEATSAVENLHKRHACKILHWTVPLPPGEGNREQVLSGYRALRNNLEARILSAFPLPTTRFSCPKPGSKFDCFQCKRAKT